MKQGWKTEPFEECIEKVTYTQKIQRKDFLDDGSYPIVSQEEAFINGYWDNEADLFKVTTPIVIFGDHTRVLKYVGFDFVVGADGVKILQPKKFLLPKFFFYQFTDGKSQFSWLCSTLQATKGTEDRVPIARRTAADCRHSGRGV